MAKKLSTGAKVGIGAGVAAAGLAAAGAYFLASKSSKGHRAKAKKLFDKAKKEVVIQAKKVNRIDRAAYERLVGTVMKGYSALREERPEELMHVANELKAGWHSMQREFSKSAPKVKAAVRKVKKAAKKLVPKKKKATKKKRA